MLAFRPVKTLSSARWPLLIGVGISILFSLGAFERVELITLDGRFGFRREAEGSRNVVVVGITPACIKKIGQLPWSRSVYADLIDKLAEAGAKVICFDMWFQTPGDPEADRRLVESTEKAGNVVYSVLCPAVLQRPEGRLYEVRSLRENMDALSRAAAGVGHINLIRDSDEIVRRMPAAIRYNGRVIYQLDLEAMIQYRGIERDGIVWRPGVLQLGRDEIPLKGPDFFINYRGQDNKMDFYSHDQDKNMDFYPLSQVLSEELPPEAFKDKIILVGQTTHGLKNADLVSTPEGTKYGLMLHAIIMDNLLRRDFLVRQSALSSILIIMFLSLAAGVILPRLSPVKSTVSFVSSLVLVTGGAAHAFGGYGIIVEIIPFTVVLLTNYSLAIGVSLKKSRREAMQKDLELSSLLQTSRISEEELDVARLPQIMADSIGETIGVDALDLYLRDESNGSLSLKGKYRRGGAALEEEEITQTAQTAHELVHNGGEAILSHNMSTDSRFRGAVRDISSLLSTPLVVGSETIGVLDFYNKRPSLVSTSDHFVAEDLRLVSVLAHQTAAILENGRLAKDLSIKNQRLIQAMTDLEEAQEELVKTEKLSAVGKMASVIIHDIKNPIGAARGYAELVGEAGGDIEATKEYSEIILNQMDRVADMLQEILDYTKGESSFCPEAVSVDTLVQEVIFMLAEDFKKMNVKIASELSFTGSIEVDKEKMLRVLLNLVRNAGEAMEEGTVTMLSECRDGLVLLSVTDDGPGIPEEIADTLFEPFVTHGKKKGTGLGLAIVKKIVEGHGGRIAVHTKLGEGTTFAIELPREINESNSLLEKEDVR